MAKKDPKEKLVDFLDKKAFDPVLSADPEDYSEDERKRLKEVQQKTEREKKRYHDEYDSAEDVRNQFRSDVHSDEAKEVNRKLSSLDLPTLPDIEDEFEKLCSKLGVGPKKKKSA